MRRHPDQGCPGFKPRVGGNGHSVDRLNADYLQIRNSQAEAKLKFAQLRVGEQERRLLPVAYVQALLSDSLVQLRQHLMSVPSKFRTQFRTVDAVMAQRVGDWLRDDINRALTRASEIEPALLSEDPFATWYRDHHSHSTDEKTVTNQKRRAKYAAKRRD
jgi:phage terminase Nu1 subunit (DNA packaging protein)